MFNDKPTFQQRANLTENDQDPASVDHSADRASDNPLDQHVLHEAYQVLQRRQRPPPKGGYPFSRNDHVTTKMGKLPPSPCRACRSSNHWDKECPDYSTLLEREKRTANLLETSSDTEGDRAYATTYSILLNERLASDVVNQSDLNESLEQQGFEPASTSSQSIGKEGSKPEGVESKHDRHSWRASLEEVEDEYWKTYKVKLKSVHHVLEEVVLDKEASHATGSLNVEPNFRSPPSEPSSSDPPNEASSSAPPMSEEVPVPDRKIKLNKRCFSPAGSSAIGVSVVAVHRHVGSMRNAPIDFEIGLMR